MRTLDRLYGTLRDLADVDADAGALPASVEEALCDDLNTPAALAEIARLAGDARKAECPGRQAPAQVATCSAAGASLGLLQQDPAAWFARGSVER